MAVRWSSRIVVVVVVVAVVVLAIVEGKLLCGCVLAFGRAIQFILVDVVECWHLLWRTEEVSELLHQYVPRLCEHILSQDCRRHCQGDLDHHASDSHFH